MEIGKRPVRYMSEVFRTEADRKLKKYFESRKKAVIANGGAFYGKPPAAA